jgi:hypothetical protein
MRGQELIAGYSFSSQSLQIRRITGLPKRHLSVCANRTNVQGLPRQAVRKQFASLLLGSSSDI